MGWILNAALTLGLLTGGFAVLERFTVYPLDLRRIDPADAGVPIMSEQIFTRQNGQSVVMWTHEAEPGQPTIFYLQGNAGNLADRAARFRIMAGRGFGIIAPAYPGSSGSSGWPTETLIRDTMAKIYATLDPAPIVYGESIGAAVAIQLAQNAPMRALILEAPFTSLRDVAHDLMPELTLLTGPMVNEWNSIDAAPQITAPLLVLHGARDTLIPPAHGQAIFDAANSTEKTFHLVENAGHTDIWTVNTQTVLFSWIDTL